MTSTELIYEDKFKENGCIQRYIRCMLIVSEQAEECSFREEIIWGSEFLISDEQTVNKVIFLLFLQIVGSVIAILLAKPLFDD